MSRAIRVRRAFVWLAACASALIVVYAGSRDVFWTGDFHAEAWPAYVKLQREGWDAFRAHLPGYSGFVILVGAPAALLGEALGWLDPAIFRATALPGLIAVTCLGARLGGEARAAGRRGWLLVTVLGAGGLLGYAAVLYGHPEDLLAAGAVVLAVLAAIDRRPTAAGVLLLVAVLAKQWAVLGILPAVLALEHGRLRVLVIAGAGSAAVVATQFLAIGGLAQTMVDTGVQFHPQQVWWPLGIEAPRAQVLSGGSGEVTAPAWLQTFTRPMLMGAAALACGAFALRRRGRGTDDVLGLLALVFALRCVLDPWNLVYYHLPLGLSLLAWEVRRNEEWPVLTLGVSVLAWVSFVLVDVRTGLLPFVIYFAWMAPLVAHLAVEVLGRPRVRPVATPARVPQPA